MHMRVWHWALGELALQVDDLVDDLIFHEGLLLDDDLGLLLFHASIVTKLVTCDNVFEMTSSNAPGFQRQLLPKIAKLRTVRGVHKRAH